MTESESSPIIVNTWCSIHGNSSGSYTCIYCVKEHDYLVKSKKNEEILKESLKEIEDIIFEKEKEWRKKKYDSDVEYYSDALLNIVNKRGICPDSLCDLLFLDDIEAFSVYDGKIRRCNFTVSHLKLMVRVLRRKFRYYGS